MKKIFNILLAIIFFLLLACSFISSQGNSRFDSKKGDTWQYGTDEQLKAVTSEDMLKNENQVQAFWQKFNTEQKNKFIQSKLVKSGAGIIADNLGDGALKYERSFNLLKGTKETLTDNKGRILDLNDIPKKDLKKIIYDPEQGFIYDFGNENQAFLDKGRLDKDGIIRDSKSDKYNYDGLKWNGKGKLQFSEGKLYLWEGAKIEATISGKKFSFEQFQSNIFSDKWRKTDSDKYGLVELDKEGYPINGENLAMAIQNFGEFYMTDPLNMNIIGGVIQKTLNQGASIKNSLEIDFKSNSVRADSDGYFAMTVLTPLERIAINGKFAEVYNGDSVIRLEGSLMKVLRDIEKAEFSVKSIGDGKNLIYKLDKDSDGKFQLYNIERDSQQIGSVVYGARGNGRNVASSARVERREGVGETLGETTKDDGTKVSMDFYQSVPGNYLTSQMREKLKQGLAEDENAVTERARKNEDSQEITDGLAIKGYEGLGLKVPGNLEDVERVFNFIERFPSISRIEYYGDDIIINGQSIKEVYPDIKSGVIKSLRNGVIRNPESLSMSLNLRQALQQKKEIKSYQSQYYQRRALRRR